MSEQSAIEWTDATWNWATGCTKVSPGCANCYIERTPPFRIAGRRFGKGVIPVLLHPERLEAPLRWAKPRMVFTLSLGDAFHEDIPFEFLERVWRVMNDARQHTFQVLTKRPNRMLEFTQWMEAKHLPRLPGAMAAGTWPLPNVWLGVSVENQRMADERIEELLRCPAPVHFISGEPLLGPLSIEPYLPVTERTSYKAARGCLKLNGLPRIDWVICGGESGPGSAERKLVEKRGAPSVPGQYVPWDDVKEWRPKPQALEWVRSLRDQCVAAGVAFHFKQWGGRTPKTGGRLLDGREWNEMPAVRG